MVVFRPSSGVSGFPVVRRSLSAGRSGTFSPGAMSSEESPEERAHRDGGQPPEEPTGTNISQRVESGVPGFDVVTGGGFRKGGIYLLAGGPGTGKTVIANQICFGRAQRGETCLYVTVLSESHGRMVGNLESFDFFDGERVGHQIVYLSGVRALHDRGLDGLYELVRSELRRREPSVIVLDGLSIGVRFAGAGEPDLNTFLDRLASLLEFHGCTGILCALSPTGIIAAEHVMADGMIELTHCRVNRRGVRDLFVSKFRGSWTLDGSHLFTIGSNGAQVFPRTEALMARPHRPPEAPDERLAFGIERLDEMLRGGLPCASSTALVGPSGAGKTLLGVSFLAENASRGRPAMYFGFNESPQRVLKQAESIGLPVGRLVETGGLEVAWWQPVELILDEVAGELLERVRQRRIEVLFIDGIEGFSRGAIFPDRVPQLIAALSTKLRASGVTTILSAETPLLGPHVLPGTPWSAIVENAIVLRYVELQAQLRRIISIVKVRGASFDPSIREFEIGERGIEVRPSSVGAEAVLSGFARPRSERSKGESEDP